MFSSGIVKFVFSLFVLFTYLNFTYFVACCDKHLFSSGMIVFRKKIADSFYLDIPSPHLEFGTMFQQVYYLLALFFNNRLGTCDLFINSIYI